MTSEELILWVASIVLGLIGVPVFDFIKQKLGIEDTSALFLVAGLSAVVGLGALLISGEIGLVDFTWSNLPNAFAAVFAAATMFYKLINPTPQT